MSINLRGQQLIARWVPGFALVYVVLLTLPGSYQTLFTPLGYTLSTGAPVRLEFNAVEHILVLVVLALIAGELLDSVRDLLEHAWDRWSPINWNYFADAAPDKLEAIKKNWFTSYVFNHNLVIPGMILLLFGTLQLRLVGLVAVAVFAGDAISLRREIARITRGG